MLSFIGGHSCPQNPCFSQCFGLQLAEPLIIVCLFYGLLLACVSLCVCYYTVITQMYDHSCSKFG